MVSISLQCLGLSVFLRCNPALKTKHRSGRSCDRYLSLTKDDDARNALQIRAHFAQLPDIRVDKLLHGFALIETDFHDQVAVLFEKSVSFLNEAADNAEPIRTRRKRHERFMIADLALQSRENARRYVRRIRNYEVKLTWFQRVEAIRNDKLRAFVDAEFLGIELRDFKSRRRLVNRNRPCVVELAQQSDRDATGSSAHVANQSCRTVHFQRCLDEQFRFRPRNQHVGRHPKLATEKILHTSDVL